MPLCKYTQKPSHTPRPLPATPEREALDEEDNLRINVDNEENEQSSDVSLDEEFGI